MSGVIVPLNCLIVRYYEYIWSVVACRVSGRVGGEGGGGEGVGGRGVKGVGGYVQAIKLLKSNCHQGQKRFFSFFKFIL